MTAEELRNIFPILSTKVYGKPLVYFDNAATSQRPRQVVEMMDKMNYYCNANIHRAVHALSTEATAAYENSREAARKFLNATSTKEIIFTSGTTAAINLVAYSFGEAFIHKGDEIIVGEAEHHSNLVPWQQLALRKGAVLKFLRLGDDLKYSVESLKSQLSDKTKLVAFNYASNVLGVVNPVKELTEIAHQVGAKVLVDGAQGAVHSLVDVQALDCDFFAFSAHKLYGPTGVGVLYGKEEILNEMPPFLCGGEMVETVTLQKTTFAPLPMKFEAGTQNFANVAALGPALELCTKLLNDNELNKEFEQIKEYLYNQLSSVEGVRVYGRSNELPVYSFNVDGVHHEDLAILLDKMGVAVRSGQMCAEPVMTHFGVTGMVRASLLQYNTKEEVDIFIGSLKRAISMLQ